MQLGSFVMNLFEKLRNTRLTESSSLSLLLFLLNMLLVFAIFFPNLSDVNAWDEAAYVNSGRELVDEGDLPAFAGNPLVSLFFGLTYLPFRTSIHWMLLSITFARILLFSMLWLSTYLVARELSEFATPLVTMGFLFVTPLSIEFLRFPSDPLFASFAAMSLWQLLRYRADKIPKNLAYASICMGMAALARNDGVILFIILVLLALILTFRTNKWWKAIGACVLPFLVITGGYVLISGAITGNYQLGVAERTYENFESGHQIIYSGSDALNPVIGARLEARRIFGTPEENNGSVFNAIKKNPTVYGERLIGVIKYLPDLVFRAYGIRFSVIIFIFALRGFFELIRKKQYILSLILILWPMHLATGFIITLFRVGHLQFPFYVVFLLAAIGVSATLENLHKPIERNIISVVLLGFTIYGLVDNKLAIFYGAALTMAAVGTIIILQGPVRLTRATMLLVLLLAGVIIRGEFPSPKLRELGIDPKEQSVAFLVENYEQGSLMGAGSPGILWAAKMRYAGLVAADVPTNRSPEDFLLWMKEQGIRAIYVDHALYVNSPELWSRINPQIGLGLDRVFMLEQGDYQILEISDGD